MTTDAYPWSAGFRSLAEEHDYRVDEIDGQVPATLRGTLFRNGSGRNDIRWKARRTHDLCWSQAGRRVLALPPAVPTPGRARPTSPACWVWAWCCRRLPELPDAR